MSSESSRSEWRVETLEHLALAEDRRDRPSILILRCLFRGDFDRQRFETAARSALTYHPLLHARVQGDVQKPTRKLRWVMEPTTLVARLRSYEDYAAAVRQNPGAAHIDLQREPGLRLFIQEKASQAGVGTVVCLQAHTACTDASGLMRFLQDLLAVYAAASNSVNGDGSEPCIEPLLQTDVEALAARGRFHMSDGERRGRLLADLAPVFGGWQGEVEPLAIAVAGAQGDIFGSCSYVFSEADCEQLQHGARLQGLNISALMVHQLLKTLAVWNNSPAEGKRSLRVALATNMRQLSDAHLPACNLTSSVFIDRLPAQIDDAESLMQEMRAARDEYRGYTRVRLAAYAGLVAGGMQYFLRPAAKNTHKAPTISCEELSVVSSSMAVALDDQGFLTAGDLELAELELLPALAPLSHASVGIVWYGSSVRLTLHYDGAVFSASEAGKFLSMYADRLRGCMISASDLQTAFLAKLKERYAGAASAQAAASGGKAKGSKIPSLWSLPIGKNVRPEASIVAALPAATK